MFPDLIFDFVLEQLADEVQQHPTPSFDPLPTDSWIARSVMQKAIRRGMVDLACRAAAQLLLIDPRTLWRRLLVTALEDLGPAEVDTTARIVAAWRDRKWRSQIGGDWPVVAELVRRSAQAIKCQSANDLWNIALHDPELAALKATLCELDQADVVSAAAVPNKDIGGQAVAVLMALGQDAGCAEPNGVRGKAADVFDAFETCSNFSHVAAICREAYRLTNVPLAALTLCLWPTHDSVQSVAKDDWFGPLHWVNGIPTFALDQYTRGGKAAIRRYARQSDQWAEFCEENAIVPKLREAAAGEILFRVDGAAVARRRAGTQSMVLRRRSSSLGCFMAPRVVMPAMSLMRHQLPLIEELRSAPFLST